MARALSKSLLLWTRTLHIYATMLALILLIFFSFTGFVMNHPTWFGDDKAPLLKHTDAKIPPELALDKGPDHRLKMVEYLRKNLAARGEMSSYEEDDEQETRVQFTAAGAKMDFSISKEDGKNDDGAPKAGAVKMDEEIHNMLAMLGDLHKGTGSGDGWRRVIDFTSIFLMFASLSGLVLWISLPKRRKLGIVSLVVSVALCLGVYLMLVP